VAVVSISRIQIRRGQKNTGSGLPQLASGELGWAVDTRELYIGNGSVAEGAPAVGNTKILSEYDDLFTLANTYEYRQNDGFFETGPDASSAITRSLQDRLDDRVSVRAFGAKGNGIADDTESLQRAIDQIYLNSATKNNPQSRVVLHLEAGTYLVSDTLYIPPYATLSGAGSDKTIIRQTADTPTFKTVNSSSQPGSPADTSTTSRENQTKNVAISSMSIEQTVSNIALMLETCRDSRFQDIRIIGNWDGGAIAGEPAALQLDSISSAVRSDNNRFENCVFESYAFAVRSDWDIEYNQFDNCEFRNLGYGIVFGTSLTLDTDSGSGKTLGPSHTTIAGSRFFDIRKNGLWIENGKFNLSINNRFEFVGTDNGPETSPTEPVVLFRSNNGVAYTNKSVNDYFARTEALISGNLNTVPYIPEIDGTAMYTLNYEHQQDFGRLNGDRLFRLPGVQNQSYEIDYTIVSNTSRAIRSGVMTLIVDGVQENVEMSDMYDYIGDADFEDVFDFQPELSAIGPSSEKNTIVVRLTSSMPLQDESTITFTVKAKKTDKP